MSSGPLWLDSKRPSRKKVTGCDKALSACIKSLKGNYQNFRLKNSRGTRKFLNINTEKMWFHLQWR